MIETLNLFAPAKLNLNLKILAKDKDNFHFIKSQICFLNLFDYLRIEENCKTSVYLDKNKSRFSLSEEKILKKTVEIFKEKFSWEKNFKITLTKNIPIGAGLGGGSADAASLLLALRFFYNKQHKGYIKLKDLFELGRKIGSDVPACIYSKSITVSGKGEKILPSKTPNNKKFLIIFPNISLSTKKVFQSFKLNNHYSNVQNFEGIKITNSLYYTACKLEPKIKEIMILISSLCHIKNYGMTGSGSTCFGIFENKKHLENALKELETKADKNWFIWHGNKKDFGFSRFLY